MLPGQGAGLARRSHSKSRQEGLRESLVKLLSDFEEPLKNKDVRQRVINLIPAFYALRKLGSSLLPARDGDSAIARIIAYLRCYPMKIIDGDELMVVSGIGEWARRVRELRVQRGWWIYSGVTFKQIAEEAPEEAKGVREALGVDASQIRPDQYVLMRTREDRTAAHRWIVSNEVRKKNISVKDKIIEYLRKNVGEETTGEELRYLAKDKKEWARRVRQLRTEDGWPIVTRNSGRSDLAVGVYVLEEDRQAEPHDRHIPDSVRIKVLQRDGFKCTKCNWSRSMLTRGDPRNRLELHHKLLHKNKGENTAKNLITLCNVHHVEIHRKIRSRR
jgi:hypothetical protein